MDLAKFYRIFQPTSAQYLFLSAAHGAFSKIDILVQKASFSRHNKMEINNRHFSIIAVTVNGLHAPIRDIE
jgi:hypothetical protein